MKMLVPSIFFTCILFYPLSSKVFPLQGLRIHVICIDPEPTYSILMDLDSRSRLTLYSLQPLTKKLMDKSQIFIVDK